MNQQLLNRVPGDISDIGIPQTQEQGGRKRAFNGAGFRLYAERLRASVPDVPVIDDLRESARMAKKMLKKLLVRLQEPTSCRMFEDVGRSGFPFLWKRNRPEESVFGKERSVREERVR